MIELSWTSWLSIAVIVAGLAMAGRWRLTAALSLSLANILVFVIGHLEPGIRSGFHTYQPVQLQLGLVADNLRELTGLGILQLGTSIFVHANAWHLLGNLLVLWFFAVPFEERIGSNMFLVVYLLSGAIGGIVDVAVDPGVDLLMGASGAVFGIIGAFAGAFPTLRVALPIPGPIMIIVPMRVWVGAALWLGFQTLVLFVISPSDNVAYAAHIGGLVAGLFLGIILRQRKPQKAPVQVDLGLLAPFARDASTTDALQQMTANRDEPAVFQAWLDRFFRSAQCPSCGAQVLPRHQGEVVCRAGHRFDVRAGRKATPLP